MHTKDMLNLLAKKGQLLASYKRQAKKACPEWQDESGYKATLDSIETITNDLEKDMRSLIGHIKAD